MVVQMIRSWFYLISDQWYVAQVDTICRSRPRDANREARVELVELRTA